MTRDDKIKSIRSAILWIVLYYVILLVISTLLHFLMRLSIFEWVEDHTYKVIVTYMISAPSSCFFVKQITLKILKEEEVQDRSRWISGIAMFFISVVIFILGVCLKDEYCFCISVFTVGILMFSYGFSPIVYMDKDGIKKVAVVVFVIVMFLLSSSLLLELFFTNESTITVYDEHIEVEEVEIETYICYITDTGSLYHSRNCQYLWNSSYRTTVYEARENGYGACSKCTPKTKTTLILEKSNVIQIPRQETEINKNYIFPTILGAVFTGGVTISTILIKKRISKKKLTKIRD